jgi:hypothetical protein
VRDGRCRPVRQWAVRLLRQNAAAALAHVGLEDWLGLLAHEDVEVVAWASEMLRSAPGLEALPVERWLALLEAPHPAAVEAVCALMETHVQPEQVTLADAVRLAASRPLPVARLGFRLLRSKQPAGEEDYRALLGLVEAQADPLRPEIVRWAAEVLGRAPTFQPEWVLEYLDSRHADVRAEGWDWFQREPRTRDDVWLWQRLLESPYDDVRLRLVADLEQRVRRPGPAFATTVVLDPGLVRFLWAAVLLNIHRGGRVKPLVVQQMVRRLAERPGEAAELLPILGAALRSVRGPEWRAGLAGVVQLVERNPGLESAVRANFPELAWPAAGL